MRTVIGVTGLLLTGCFTDFPGWRGASPDGAPVECGAEPCPGAVDGTIIGDRLDGALHDHDVQRGDSGNIARDAYVGDSGLHSNDADVRNADAAVVQSDAQCPQETCDNADNDCDGRVDEGTLNACNACGPVEVAEVCDGVDQDCDGSTDESAPCAVFEACREGRCQEAPIVYEAERDFMHATGQPSADGWCGIPAPEVGAGHLIYGPYVDTLPQGRLVATFWLLADYNPARVFPDTVFARLEIIDADDGGRQIQGHGYPATPSGFGAPMTWAAFPVTFDNPGGHRLEFRIWWDRTNLLCVDRVEVAWAP